MNSKRSHWHKIVDEFRETKHFFISSFGNAYRKIEMYWFEIKCAFLKISRLNKHHNHHDNFQQLVSNNLRVARWHLYLRQITKPLIGSQPDSEKKYLKVETKKKWSGAELSQTWSLVLWISGLSIIRATKPAKKLRVANRSSFGSIVPNKVHWIGYRSLLFL